MRTQDQHGPSPIVVDVGQEGGLTGPVELLEVQNFTPGGADMSRVKQRTAAVKDNVVAVGGAVHFKHPSLVLKLPFIIKIWIERYLNKKQICTRREEKISGL